MDQNRTERAQRERRRDPRYDRSVPLRMGHEGQGLRAESINISTRGLYCKVGRFVPAFSKLRVALDLPFPEGDHRTVECDGVVVRVEPEQEMPGVQEYRLAIYFLNLDQPSARVIEEFLVATQN